MPDFDAKMHQNRFRLGLRPRPRWGAYSAPPDPLAGFKGATSTGRGGDGRGKEKKGRDREREGREERGKGERKREGEEEGRVRDVAPSFNSWIRQCTDARYCYRKSVRPSVCLYVRPSTPSVRCRYQMKTA